MRPGAVVSSRGRIGVVWRVLSSGLAIVPVVPGQPRTRGDLAVDGLADRIAVVAMGASCVRAGHVLSVPAEGQECIGDVTPALLARIEAAVARAATDRADAAKWESDRVYRRIAGEMAG